MSFQNKSFWMPRDAGCLTDGDINYETPSRTEPKRGHQWFMDATEQEIFCNKKQATESVFNSRPMPGISNANVSLWENSPSFQSVSGHFADRLSGSETARPFNLVDRSIPAVGTGHLNMASRVFVDHFGSNSSVGLSVSCMMEDPSSSLNYDGLRKVIVNQVRNSENGMPVSIGHSYSRGDDNTMSSGTAYNKNDDISLGPAYNGGNEITFSMGPTFNTADNNFSSTGHTFNKGDGNFVFMGHNYSKGDANILSMGQPFDREDGAFISMDHRCENGNGNIISTGPAYNKGQENFTSIGSAYNKTNGNFISIGPSFGKGDNNIISMGPTPDKEDMNFVSMGTTFDQGNSSILSMRQSYNKGESSTISFGGFQDEPQTNASGGILSGYDLLTSPSAQHSKAPGQENTVEHNNTDPIAGVDPTETSKTKANPKNKEKKPPKKLPPNNFPSNVKSLLSTGMFDGVPVKYVSWSREKDLKGIIKGTGYLCGCEDCKFSKGLNAYEFERHADCKTKHPNNHIYFENGKTVYAVVQELKSMAQETLFDAIQTVTGSPINQKNFHIWKASYEAATRELQRIYGKDEVIMPS